VVVPVDGAANRVLERHHAVRGALLLDRLEHLVEGLARQRLGLRAAVGQRGSLAVGARFSLVGESHGCPLNSAAFARAMAPSIIDGPVSATMATRIQTGVPHAISPAENSQIIIAVSAMAAM